MASSSAVWGIDIGNSSLKALRCRPAEEPGKIEALAFDFIEHSKILTQPGAEPAEILAETLETFLSRNSTKGDQVAISVSGQNTISRFLKLPPVDPKKVPDIIKYEAKQWLPFDLDDVIWDFQPIGLAGMSDTAAPMDSEVGMFAMKRDIALKTLDPYNNSGINVDCIQSSPLALYNFATFDQLPPQNIEDYDSDNPPESIVILCVGTEATDVVVTNGYTIWIRSIPIGGNVFTKALTKGLKLTSSKAEYLKRHAAAAQDPKAVFQAMRPVFNDMLSEVHRSLEYYQSLNRKVKFKRILALGNAMKMPGLRQFLTQNLGYDVTRLGQFNNLVGTEVVEAPLFKENLFSFAVSYGLVIQQLGEASLTTNLIPKEIVTDRIIREKKPWALVGASALMLGMVFYFAGASRALSIISSGDYQAAEQRADTVDSYSKKMISGTAAAVAAFKKVDNIGSNLTSGVEGRLVWLELLKAINDALPKEQEQLGEKQAEEISRQNRVFVSNIEAITVNDLATWFAPLKQFHKYYPDDEEIIAAIKAKEAAPKEGDGAARDAATSNQIPIEISKRLAFIEGPKKPEGDAQQRVVQIVGHHYHNADIPGSAMGAGYMRETLLRNLKYNKIDLPPTLEKQNQAENRVLREEVSMEELGISYPTLLDIPKIETTDIINPQIILQIYMQQMRDTLQQERRGTSGGGGGFGGGGGGFGGGFGGGGRNRESAITTIGSSLTTRGTLGGSLSPEMQEEILKAVGGKDRIRLRRFDFVVQFAWVITPPSVREEKRRKEQEALAQAEGNAPTTTLREAENIEVIDQPEDEVDVPPLDGMQPETEIVLPPLPELDEDDDSTEDDSTEDGSMKETGEDTGE